MKKVPVYASDHGYGDMKTSTGIIFPTDIVNAQPNTFGSPRNPLDQIVYSDERATYFIGDLARMTIEAKPELVSTNEKLNRYYFRTHQYKATMLAGIAASYPEAEAIRINVFVTGLPTAYWEQDHVELQQIFEGMHEFTVSIGTETREMKVKIDAAYVIPQPYGTLCFFAYDEKGDERNVSLLEDYVGTADFGFNTTDLQLTYKGTTVEGKLESLTDLYETVGSTYKSISNQVHRDTGTPIPIQTLRRHIQKGQFGYFKGAKREMYNISTLAHNEFKKTAERVLEKSITLWGNYGLDYVIITGGGANIPEIIDAYRETFGDVLITPSNEKDKDGNPIDPVFANVYGYHRFGTNVYRFSGEFEAETETATEK